MPSQHDTQRAKVLLLGTLPGGCEATLIDRFELLRSGGLNGLPEPVEGAAAQIRGIAYGMVDDHGPAANLTEPFMSLFPALEIIANFGVGYEHIDVAEATRRGIVVTHTPNVLTEEVADLAVGLLIATVRRLPQADRFVRQHRWADGEFPLGASLRGRRLGILGLGRIGKAIALRAAAFGLEVAYHGRTQQPDVPYRYFPTLGDMAQEVDILLISVPGGDASRGLVDRTVLHKLGPEGVLINVGRGSVVDENALIDSLETKIISAAGLDVFPQEPHVAERLIALDNVVLLPHLGSSSLHTRSLMARLCVDNLVSWFDGHGPRTAVPV